MTEFLPHIVGEERAALFARFWSSVWIDQEITICWPWAGGKVLRPDGAQSYGRFTVRGEHIYAHRFMYQMVHGELPDELIVRHKCDYEPCVNPFHLLSGTMAQNTMDKFERGRGADRKGEKHPLVRLSTADVEEIRRLGSLGHTHLVIAGQFGVCRQYIGKIMRRENWSHV
jgi:hypothetical protein